MSTFTLTKNSNSDSPLTLVSEEAPLYFCVNEIQLQNYIEKMYLYYHFLH